MSQSGGKEVKGMTCGAYTALDGKFNINYFNEETFSFCPYKEFDYCHYDKKKIDTSKECGKCFFSAKY